MNHSWTAESSHQLCWRAVHEERSSVVIGRPVLRAAQGFIVVIITQLRTSWRKNLLRSETLAANSDSLHLQNCHQRTNCFLRPPDQPADYHLQYFNLLIMSKILIVSTAASKLGELTTGSWCAFIPNSEPPSSP